MAENDEMPGYPRLPPPPRPAEVDRDISWPASSGCPPPNCQERVQ